jgi:hypothetical protein
MEVETKARLRRYAPLRLAVLLGLVASLVAAFRCVAVFFAVVESLLLGPPKRTTQLDDFREFVPEPRAITKIPRREDVSYVLLGNQLLWNEYPPGYAFDERGRLLFWSGEASDSDEHSAVWLAAYGEMRLGHWFTYDEVLAELSGRPSGRERDAGGIMR